jgi:CubicO group peptidase (beta-lactamase class C family)
MKPRSIAVATGLLLGCAIPGVAEDRFPAAGWDHIAPETAGWSSQRLHEAEEWSRRIGSHSVMVIYRGAVIAEWGATAAKIPLYSVRKSLLSALIGNAVERGDLSLKQTIGSLGIDDNAPSLSAEEKSATVQNLLEARSGVYHAALYETPEMAAQRPPRGSHKPGTFWYYNNWDFNTLGAIYEHAVRSSIFDAFEREIARPIGMQDYVPADGDYETGAASVYPAYAFNMSSRDLARFALLYLQKGKWRDRQVVPGHWVDESTQPYSQSGFGPGYAYLWWTGFLDPSFEVSVRLPPGAFAAWGNGSQYAYVLPDDDLVVVHRTILGSSTVGLREFGRLLWLVLDAGHFSDIGPDATIEAARGTHLDEASLGQLLPGKTLLYGEGATGGPYRVRLNADGTAAALKGREPVQYDTGSWRIEGGRFCRDWQTTRPQHLCLTVVAQGDNYQFFDNNGLMFLNSRLVDN